MACAFGGGFICLRFVIPSNAGPTVRELSADEVELVSGGNGLGTRALNTVAWWLIVSSDYYFNTGGGKFFHSSNAVEDGVINSG